MTNLSIIAEDLKRAIKKYKAENVKKLVDAGINHEYIDFAAEYYTNTPDETRPTPEILNYKFKQWHKYVAPNVNVNLEKFNYAEFADLLELYKRKYPFGKLTTKECRKYDDGEHYVFEINTLQQARAIEKNTTDDRDDLYSNIWCIRQRHRFEKYMYSFRLFLIDTGKDTLFNAYYVLQMDRHTGKRVAYWDFTNAKIEGDNLKKFEE